MMDLQNTGHFEDAEVAMRVMLMQLLNPLIVYSEFCSVNIVRRGDMTTFLVQIEPEDLELLTGGGSRTAKSLQIIVGAVGMKSRRKFSLTFCEKGGTSAQSMVILPEITKT